MEEGTVGILNVGAGDIRVSFDKRNPAELIRARRVVKDMLRRGYALLVEVERNGEKKFERAIDFDESNDCYIIADFDPEIALNADRQDAYETELNKSQENTNGESKQSEAGVQDVQEKTSKRRGRPGRYSVSASGTRAVGVARSAGG